MAIIAVVTSLAFGPSASEGRHPPDRVVPEAFVTSRGARFLFSVPDRSSWSWNLPSTSDMHLEYLWTVDVRNGRDRYQFGFVHFKYADSQPATGDLEALLGAGQHSVARLLSGEASVLGNARVRAVVHEGDVAIEVEDPETLKLLFSARPRRATLRTILPGEKQEVRDVEVRYRE